MKLQFKHQKFQADAAKAVCDVFAGQPYLTPTYMMDRGAIKGAYQVSRPEEQDYTGFRNQPLVSELNDVYTANINRYSGAISCPSKELEGR
jgi:type III restriction enzyme